MGKKFKPLSWKVKNYDCNANKIVDYDILKYREEQIKKFKKQSKSKEEFAEKLSREFRWQYLSRAEYELIVVVDENDRIWLEPWVGCRNVDETRVDVTDDDGFDWRDFSEKHIGKQIYKNKAKFDVWDQIFYQWVTFIDYVWNFHHKWQRVKKAEENV